MSDVPDPAHAPAADHVSKPVHITNGQLGKTQRIHKGVCSDCCLRDAGGTAQRRTIVCEVYAEEEPKLQSDNLSIFGAEMNTMLSMITSLFSVWRRANRGVGASESESLLADGS